MAEPEKSMRGRITPQKPESSVGTKRPNQVPGRLERASRKTLSKKRREEMQQQWLIRALIGIVSFSILMIIIGLLYDGLWVPSRVVAQVGEVRLTHKAFLQEVRYAFAREIIQNLQLVEMFRDNEQIRQQYALRSPVIGEGYRELTRYPFADIRRGIPRLREQYGLDTAQLTDQVLREWEERQLVSIGAAEIGITPDSPEVHQRAMQAMVDDMEAIFSPPPTSTITQTATISPTAIISPTTPLTPTHSLTEVGTTTTSDDVVTHSPTETTQPTLAPTEADSKLQEIFARIFQRYQEELTQVRELRNITLHPQFTAEDFRRAMEQHYRHEQIIGAVKERLVPTETAETGDKEQLNKVRDEKYQAWVAQLRERIPMHRFPEEPPTPTLEGPAEEVEGQEVTTPLTTTHAITGTSGLTVTIPATYVPIPKETLMATPPTMAIPPTMVVTKTVVVAPEE